MASEINAELLLEIKGFLDGIKKSQDAASKFSDKGKKGAGGWSGMLGKVGSGIVAVGKVAAVAGAAVIGVGTAIAGALAVGIKSALDMGGKFSDLAAQMGTTAGEARVLAAAFENNGMTAEHVANTVNKMSKTLNDAESGLGSAQRAFNDLGLDSSELIKDDPTAAFQKIMTALGGVKNESERVGMAMNIFGRSGGKLGVLLKDAKAMENARALIGGQAAILDEHAAEFDRASDVLNQMGTKMQGFFVGVGAKIIDAIMPAIEWLNQLDLTAIGERFGAALMDALNVAKAIFQVFSSMSLAEVATLFGTLLKLGISESINFLMSVTAAAFSALIAYFIEGIKNSIALFSILATADFWSGMLSALMGIAQAFAGFLLTRISQIITAIKSATGKLGEKIFGNSDEAIAEIGGVLTNSSKENFSEAGDSLAPAFEKVGERMKATGAAMGAAFSKTMANSVDFIDTSEEKAAIADVASQISSAAKQIAAANPTKAETGNAGSGESAAPAALPALNSRLSGAINTISGRSANAIIASESAKTSANTERTAKATEEIAKNTAGGTNTNQPVPKPTSAHSGRFA